MRASGALARREERRGEDKFCRFSNSLSFIAMRARREGGASERAGPSCELKDGKGEGGWGDGGAVVGLPSLPLNGEQDFQSLCKVRRIRSGRARKTKDGCCGLPGRNSVLKEDFEARDASLRFVNEPRKMKA